MKIKKPKRIMSLFLAALMCVTSLVGMGTTAYAAEETDDVYLISFPRDGDSNYNAEWGHGSLTFMNGWKTGNSRYTTVRAMGSYQLLDNTALEVVQSPEKFRAYLDVQSRMDRYTANNALLMYKQFPQASQIKEFDDWAAEGVKVNKGSKTFIILDPYEYTKKDGTIGIDFNLKRVLDVSQTNGKRPAAPTANRDPRKLVAVMLDSAPINIESTNELPYPDMGAFYKNEDQTLYVKRDIGDSVALCQCVAQELGHAELSMNSEVYSRRDMGFQAVCIGYMLCKKYGVDTQNFAIDRIPDELKNKEPKDIKAELGKTQKAFKEITARVSDELYRQRAERSKEQER